MKKLIIFLLLLLPVTVIHAQDTEGTEPAFNKQLVPVERVHDFGNIEEKNGAVHFTFKLRNTGNTPIAISDVRAWCGCTTSSFTNEPIRPGKTGNVTVTFNPYGRPGKFSKEVVVFLNNGKEYIRLWVKGVVNGYDHPITEDHPYALGEGLYSSHLKIIYSPMQVGEKKSFRIRFANSTKQTMTVEFDRVPFNRVIKLPEKLTLKPNERTVIDVDYTLPRERKNSCHITLYPKVNGKRVKPLKVIWIGSDLLPKQ